MGKSITHIVVIAMVESAQHIALTAGQNCIEVHYAACMQVVLHNTVITTAHMSKAVCLNCSLREALHAGPALLIPHLA